MKLGVTREHFEDQIRKGLYEAGSNRNTQEKITNKLAEKGYKIADITDMFEDNIKLNTLSLMDLGVIATVLYRELDLSYVDPSLYLTDIEIDEVKKYKFESVDNTIEFPIIFKDCLQKSNDSWITILHAKDIANLYRSSIIRYNPETQREIKKIQVKDNIIEVPNVNYSSVKEIENELIQGTFISNILTFNLKNAEFKYDNERQKIIILNGKLDIIDGFHRSLGIIGALRKKDIDYNFEIRFTNFDEDKAKRFIVQEDKRNPISKEYLRKIDTTDLVSKIVNNLNEDGGSELRGLITTDTKTITEGYSLVSFEMMYNTIKELWQPSTIREAENIADYLKDFFNELVFIYPDELKLYIKESRKFSQINDERMFALYLVIAKLLVNNQNLGLKLKNIIENTIITNEFKDYIETAPSIIKNNIKSHIENITKIIEGVIKNETSRYSNK